VTPERIAELRDWIPRPAPVATADDGRRVWQEMLDEIERLQEANRQLQSEIDTLEEIARGEDN